MDSLIWAVISGVLALGVAAFLANYVMHQDEGTDKMKEIAGAIREGAQAFLGREYRIMAIFLIVVAVILAVIPNLGWKASVSFILGGLTSAAASFIGMQISIRSNSRSCAAVQHSLNKGLQVAFRGGCCYWSIYCGYRHSWYQHYLFCFS